MGSQAWIHRRPVPHSIPHSPVSSERALPGCVCFVSTGCFASRLSWPPGNKAGTSSAKETLTCQPQPPAGHPDQSVESSGSVHLTKGRSRLQQADTSGTQSWRQPGPSHHPSAKRPMWHLGPNGGRKRKKDQVTGGRKEKKREDWEEGRRNQKREGREREWSLEGGRTHSHRDMYTRVHSSTVHSH